MAVDPHDERPTRGPGEEPWDVRHVGRDQRPSVPLTRVERDVKQVVGWPDREIAAIAAAQQAIIADNQTKIDAKLATIGENVRQARIYAGRGR